MMKTELPVKNVVELFCSGREFLGYCNMIQLSMCLGGFHLISILVIKLVIVRFLKVQDWNLRLAR